MSVAVYTWRKYSKYTTAYSGSWNVPDHMLNCIYSLEKSNPQQQLHLPPHPKCQPVAPGDSSGLLAHRTDSSHSCPSTVTASYTSRPREFHLLLAVLLASSFCNKKPSHLLQSCPASFKTIYAALIIFDWNLLNNYCWKDDLRKQQASYSICLRRAMTNYVCNFVLYLFKKRVCNPGYWSERSQVPVKFLGPDLTIKS